MMKNKQKNSITDMDIKLVCPNPDQPRKDFDEAKLEELAASVRQYGVLEPIVVTPRGRRFMIVAGERRHRAALLAGLVRLPARVIEADDALVEELALLENVQRQDLNPIEEATAYRRLLDRGWSIRKLADQLGYKKVGAIENRIILLNLAPEYREMTAKGELSPTESYEMAKLPEDRQHEVFQRLSRGELRDPSRLYAFVSALMDMDRRRPIFALTPPTQYERRSLEAFEGLMKNVERLIANLQKDNGMKHLEKAGQCTGISSERVGLIIRELQKIKKALMTGEGAAEAHRSRRAAA